MLKTLKYKGKGAEQLHLLVCSNRSVSHALGGWELMVSFPLMGHTGSDMLPSWKTNKQNDIVIVGFFECVCVFNDCEQVNGGRGV